jgi:hypothetical protein
MTDKGYDSLFESLVEIAGDDVPIGDINRMAEELHAKGMKAWMLKRLANAGVSVSIGGPPALPEPKAWFVAVQRWPTACRRCSLEVPRGAFCHLGRLPDDSWVIECGDCRDGLDVHGERAQEACKRAVLKEIENGDAEDLIERMTALAPDHDAREMVEDLIALVVAQER